MSAPRRYVVGEGGRRLRRSVPWAAIAVVVVIGAVALAGQFLR